MPRDERRGPNLDLILEKVESKFALITIVAKRAKQLVSGSRPLVDTPHQKPVSIALDEIAADKVKYHKIPDREELDGEAQE
ncbi:MAG: DNA-directed RNA polymerase subunit omega [Candidatus Xenobia bacterium]